ncbi:MAG: hypothetical protein LUE27_00925 [Clostridia bacterium]|nr:hypothetical protein [Clostridia bacterium]
MSSITNIEPETPEIAYKMNLYALHKHTFRHTLVLEADLSENDKRHVFSAADRLRMCGNALVADMMKHYDQLVRTKKYRSIMRAYGKAKEAGNEVLKKELSDKLEAMRKQYDVTWTYCRKKMIDLESVYNLNCTLCLAKAEDVWYGMEKLLYSNGEKLRFKVRGDLPILRAKERHSCIPIHACKDGRLRFRFGDIRFTYIDKPDDKFVNDELAAILGYLRNPEENDRRAVEAYLKDGTLTDTYRPCYASLKCVRIRGKLRVFIHIMIEGKAMRKYRKARDSNGDVIYDSNGDVTYIPRHMYGKGIVGVDIGTQTIAYTSETEVGLKNLAERGDSIQHREAVERRISRAMTRSRKAMNPDNINPNGSYKKGKKTWNCSRRYRRLRDKHKELNRIAAENRHYSIKEDVNHLRELGDVFVTEPGIADRLQKRPKTKQNHHVKNKHRIRYAKSIRNRCPGYFQSWAKKVFESTGGRYIEVPRNYRASQYDHTADAFVKKELYQRMFYLADGTIVLRDWYSSFLLYNADGSYKSIDKARCKETFPAFYRKEKALIEDIRQSGKKVMNSWI